MVGASKRVYHGAVSTHSRPKAAGSFCQIQKDQIICFNTQPPEGGWMAGYYAQEDKAQFQHTAARRRLVHLIPNLCRPQNVSTHSRPKAAGMVETRRCLSMVCFNTQPPEGGWILLMRDFLFPRRVSTHSRPKAAGHGLHPRIAYNNKFQHTAARRRLGLRIKAGTRILGFNTQPPEGGWFDVMDTVLGRQMFQHTAARRRLAKPNSCLAFVQRFQHTAARRRLGRSGQSRTGRCHVSTHSRPKAAGTTATANRCYTSPFQHTAARRRLERQYRPLRQNYVCFNTQPPEGGWRLNSPRLTK